MSGGIRGKLCFSGREGTGRYGEWCGEHDGRI